MNMTLRIKYKKISFASISSLADYRLSFTDTGEDKQRMTTQGDTNILVSFIANMNQTMGAVHYE